MSTSIHTWGKAISLFPATHCFAKFTEGSADVLRHTAPTHAHVHAACMLSLPAHTHLWQPTQHRWCRVIIVRTQLWSKTPRVRIPAVEHTSSPFTHSAGVAECNLCKSGAARDLWGDRKQVVHTDRSPVVRGLKGEVFWDSESAGRSVEGAMKPEKVCGQEPEAVHKAEHSTCRGLKCLGQALAGVA